MERVGQVIYLEGGEAGKKRKNVIELIGKRAGHNRFYGLSGWIGSDKLKQFSDKRKKKGKELYLSVLSF